MINVTVDNSYKAIEDLYIAGLFEDNFKEADPRASFEDFEVNLESSFHLLDAGMLGIVVAKDEDELVGYLIYTIVPKDLFTKSTVASTICVYVKPEYRGGTAFKRILDCAENSAKERGAKVLHVGLTPNSVNLERFGYHTDNVVYSKRLEV